jgi:tetratricopeptide (TPR) repeat protein
VIDRLRMPLGLLVAVLLGACASGPTESTRPGSAVEAPRAVPRADDQLERFRQLQTAQARLAEAEGRWADAIQAWEILRLLNPTDDLPRDRWQAAVQHRKTLAEAQAQLAMEAERRGEAELAVQHHLQVLALDPGNEAAATALRDLERERNRRSVVGRFASPPMARPNGSRQALRTTRPSGRVAQAQSNSVREHATMLARQGDLDGAIQMLRETPRSRTDPELRSTLIDLYLENAEKLRTVRPDEARAAVDAALALDRRHARALALRMQMRGTSAAAPAPAAQPGQGIRSIGAAPAAAAAKERPKR